MSRTRLSIAITCIASVPITVAIDADVARSGDADIEYARNHIDEGTICHQSCLQGEAIFDGRLQ